MSAYTVLATELQQQTSAIWDHGQLRVEIKRYHRGDTVTNLSDDDVKRHLATGSIAAKSSPEAKLAKETPAPEPEDVEYIPPRDQPGPIVAEAAANVPEDTDDRPRKTAPKPVWVDYAVVKGIDRDKAEKMTREDIAEATK